MSADDTPQHREQTADEAFDNWYCQRCAEPWRHSANLEDAMRAAWLQSRGLPEPVIRLTGNKWEMATGIRVINLSGSAEGWEEDEITQEQFLSRCVTSCCSWPQVWLNKLIEDGKKYRKP